MSSVSPDNRFQNPFSTRRVRPGALAHVFASGQDAARLVERLAANGWRGEIVGPHGSGKSSLLAALLPAIVAGGRRPFVIALHDGERRLPVNLRRIPGLSASTLVIVDGYEQLGRWNRWRLGRLCSARGWGLLVTAHRPAGLPLVAQTSASLELAQTIVGRLLPSGSSIGRQEVAERFAAQQGNLRELLWELYDLYEARRDNGPAESVA
jgi:hypothetical protein